MSVSSFFTGQNNQDNRAGPADDDALLVVGAQNGDMGAFEELVRKYETKVFAVASRMLSSGEDAKDATQEAFLKAYRSIRNFRGESKFSTWLYRITNNVCLDYLRRRNRYDISIDYDQGLDDSGFTPVEIPSDINIEDEVEGDEFKSLVHRAINKLPEQHRVMIVMRDIQDLSYMEISELSGLPEGTVKSRINRARKNLRDIFLATKELKEYINV